MPFEKRRRLHARRESQTPACDRREYREHRTSTNVAVGHRPPSGVRRDHRRALGQNRRDDERNRKVNQQRVEPADECHLRV
jgi:hypothetical protein